jgi:tetratricopeptide (TPR) repeat protein
MTAFIARHKKLLLTLSLLVVLIGGWWLAAPVRGRLGAYLDLSRGHYRLLTFGLPPAWLPEYSRLLRERYGVEVVPVAGCVVSPALVSYVDGYDKVSESAARRKFGRDIFSECAEEARKIGELQTATAKHGTVTVDWKGELAKAKAGIRKNPKSAYWHNQAGIAYDALGEFKTAVKELKLACTLDPSDPGNYYSLYALYKRESMHSEQRRVLLDALEADPNNPLGRFEFAYILEEEKHWPDALREYRVAKSLAASVEGPLYKDSRGGVCDVTGVREEVDRSIERVEKLSESARQQRQESR